MVFDKSNIGFETSSSKLNLRKIYIQGLLTSFNESNIDIKVIEREFNLPQ